MPTASRTFLSTHLVFSHIHGVMRALLDDLAPTVKMKMARTRAEYLLAFAEEALAAAGKARGLVGRMLESWQTPYAFTAMVVEG